MAASYSNPPRFAFLRVEMGTVGEVEERFLLRVGDEEDVSAFAAVSAVRAAHGNELFAAKGHGAVAARARR